MKNDSAKRNFFNLPRMVQTAIYLPLVFLILYICLRQLEFLVTYHPQPYLGGPEWTPPANGVDVWCKVANGQKVHGWYVHAQMAPAFATVLFCHGNGGNLTNVAWIAQELSKHNLDVLIFDYRGYGRSDGKISDEWGLYADTEAFYDYLVRDRGIKDEKLVLIGESLGSTAAIDLASRRRCGALIVESGLSSASDMGVKAFPWLPRWLHLLARNRFDSETKIANINCPVLVTHGTDDQVIPVDQGRKLYERAREPKKLIIVQGGKHNLLGEGGAGHLNQIVDFIRKSIK
ncbi:MAG: alpha/beta hydrolase [Acidobacteria bacterium]|nr:alpha/beta hydrolase [Acidobacteriota bacterium]